MWFGTEDGLNKYDATTFTIYRHISTEGESLSSSYIHAITEQSDGYLWIATNDGLNCFNPDNEKFTRYLHDPGDSLSLSNSTVNSLLFTSDRRLLVGTSDGLNVLDASGGFLKYFPPNFKRPYHVVATAQDKNGHIWVLSSSMIEKIRLVNGNFSRISSYELPANSIKSVMLLDSLYLWVGASNQLIRFSLQHQKFETFRFYGSKGTKDPRNNVQSIINDQDGRLWIGTIGGGVIVFNKSTGRYETIINDSYNPFSLNSNNIRSLYLDETGIFWIGTYGGGINKYDPALIKFQHIQHQTGKNNSLSDNVVRSVLLDRDGELWVGTHAGLNRINRKTGYTQVYKYKQGDLSTISSNTVRALCEDSVGNIWAGTWDNGLNSFNKKTGRFKRYIYLPENKDSLVQVRSVETDAQANIWIGSNRLWMFNPKTQKFKSYIDSALKANGSGGNIVNKLYFDHSGLLWVGTQNGLFCVDTASNYNRRFYHSPQDTLSISHQNVTSIAEDKSGSLWVGTYGGGFNKLDVSTGTFVRYSTKNGLLNDVIYAILIDSSGFIWYTSNAGLGKFDPKKQTFKYFGVDAGIQSIEFNAGACFKSKSGEFFFGGINGLNAYFPRNINNENETGKIVFTDFELLDEKEASTGNILNKHISRTDYIKLNYSQNTFSLKFSELNFSENANNSYEYLLEGFENDWRFLGKKKKITIGNLKPGIYTLQVRVRGDLSNKATISIVIQPPLWQSPWAYLSYFIAVAAILVLVYRSIRKNKRLRKKFESKIRDWENNIKARPPIPETAGTGVTLNLKTTEVKSVDQQFLERVMKIAEDHIEDSNFTVEKFAEEMFMSRSQLHRRLISLTGQSATKFIRLIRLKRAAQLLSGNAGTVSEISYRVGFENIGYFSKCFYETFGVPPSQYKTKSRTDGESNSLQD